MPAARAARRCPGLLRDWGRTLQGVTWSDDAQELLDAAAGSGVAVDRAFVAPGPDFAKDCRLLAVHLQLLSPRAPGSALPSTGCLLAPAWSWVVTFAADCCPMPTQQGERVSPPAVATVDAWSKAMLDDAQLVWEAVADFLLAGGCAGRALDPMEVFGPSGGVGGVRIPVRLMSIA